MQSLITTVTKYNVAIDGKDDVRLAINTIKATSNAIIAMRADPTSSPYPPAFVEKIIEVLKTTSNDIFNGKIDSLLKEAEHQRKLSSAAATTLVTNDEAGLDLVLNYTSTTLTDMEREGTWISGLSSDKNSSAFSASTNNPCFNCGEPGCTPTKCKEKGVTVDKDRVKANRDKWRKTNKKKKTRPYKWRLPEPHENGKRIVDDKPHEWNKEKEFWKEIKAPESGLTDVAGNVAGNTVDTSTTGTATAAEAVAVDADAGKIQLQLANLFNQQNTMINNQNEMKNNQNEMKAAII